MTEKYKIYVPEEMRSRLLNDAELFDFAKKDGSVNLNAFLKELLVNYFDEYRERKSELHDAILEDLSAFSSISQRDAKAITERILNTYAKNQEFVADRDCAITLTVSGRSLDVMNTIENNLVGTVSLSQYVNDLFSSYLSIARSQRERIIFRETYDAIETAIRKKNVITFTSTSAVPGSVFTVKPYLIAASKEEQCNYLLCQNKSSAFTRTFRISRIRALYVTQESFTPDAQTMRELKEIAIRNPQSASKNVEASVYLTDRGIQKFRVIVKNRPDVQRRDGNTYYFCWPLQQLEDYFARFGKDAIFLTPKEGHDHLTAFYKNALEAYAKRKTVRVVAGIIRSVSPTGETQYFATQRGYGEFKDGWEFPGGKIEPGENAQDALIREIREELDAEISVGEKLMTIEYDYPKFHLSMDCFLCALTSDHMELREHEAARWLTAAQLPTVDWLPADKALIQKLME